MLADLNDAVTEIFQFRELLKDIVFAAMNSPDEYLDKVFKVYEQFVDLVETFDEFTVDEIQTFLDDTLSKYSQKPFFPVLAGLYVNALLNRAFRSNHKIEIDLGTFCAKVIEGANQDQNTQDAAPSAEEVGFSLDYLGYLLPDEKTLVINGPVGDFCGALMGENSTIIVNGLHGKHFGYVKDPSAKIVSQ